MKNIKKILALFLVAALVALTLTACGSSQDNSSSISSSSTSSSEASGSAASSEPGVSTGDEASDATITMAFTTAWDSLMPYHSASGSMFTSQMVNFIFDRLALVTDGGNTLRPRAAVNWESADGGYSVVFHLNPDSKWHDGKPVTADDWVFTAVVFTDPEAAGASISCSLARELAGTDETGSRIEGETFGVEALDDHTLKFTLKNPVTPEDFLNRFNRYLNVLPRHLLEDIPVTELADNEFWSAPIGSGPCIFDREVIGSEIYLKANREYQFPVTGFGTLKCVVMDSANTLQAEISGDIDLKSIGSTISADSVPIAEAAGLSTEENEYGTFFLELILNNQSLDDVNLRLAIYYALDREQGTLISAQGQGRVVDSYVLPYSDYCNTDLKRERDVEKAKEHLAQSNYDGHTLTLACAASRVELTSYFQQNLAEAGINIEILNVDVATMFTGLTAGTYDIGISGHTGTPYPLWFANTVLASNYGDTYYNVTDPTYEEIYNQIISEVDDAKRRTLINEFQEYIFNNVPWIPIYYSSDIFLLSPTVEGVDYKAATFCNDNVWEWKKAAK